MQGGTKKFPTGYHSSKLFSGTAVWFRKLSDANMLKLCLVVVILMVFVPNGEARNRTNSFDTTSLHGSMLPESVEALHGKTLLMLGCRKTDAIEMAPSLGIRLIIVTSKHCHNDSTYDVIPEIFIHDMTDHTRDREHSTNIVSLLRSRNYTVHGCCTFEDDLSVIAAMISEELDLVSPEVDGVLSAKKKSMFFQKMASKVDNVCIDAKPYAVPTYLIQNERDLIYYMKRMKFPLILKLEHGTGSAGVSVVKNELHCISTYRNLREQSDKHKSQGGSGFGFGDTFVLMEFAQGSEHSVDIVMYKGELIAIFIKDKLTTLDGRFMESIAIMPSGLSIADQEKITLASYWTCRKIGLNSGVFNLDIMFGKDGPKVIEVNARMGGNYHRDWVYHLYKFDIAVALYQVSLDIRPRYGVLGSCGVIAGTMLTNSSHYAVLDRQSFKEQVSEMVHQGLILFKTLRNSTNCGTGDFEKTRANLAVIGETRYEAMRSLTRLTRNFHINDSFYILNTLF
ncbi:hypothetical protein FSP39_005787 [Pinctada imbricata]|uniref:ATP-grasp domain-containing protein n=1 Tax=Pinctada imbricata TaxID=66713 RepID=A0AA89C9Z4_PINIB|nr:hypothetical protein FSP39_005787 [Pinctada imbricata]